MRETIKTIVIVLLVVVAIYYAFVVSKVNARVDFLNAQDSIHVQLNNQFARDLEDLNLQFIGRGHHIQDFQRELKSLDLKLDLAIENFDTKIDSVGFVISEFQMNTETEFNRIRTDIDGISERLSDFQRLTNRTLTDLQASVARLNRELNSLEGRVKAIEEAAKETEEKGKRR
jgi:chromosome segregation ATPase